jgi:dTDP-4-amino-4,6-dideoxygalactose transaminase
MTSPSPQLPFLPFALPEIGEEEINEVVDTLRSGWVTTGGKAKRFEADFVAYLQGGAEQAAGQPPLHAIAVNSATAGLHLALEALGIGPGDEVITTTHTFTATAEVVRYLGADVKLVDIDPATLNINPALIEAAITPRTKAIMPVHFAGLAAPMQAVLATAKKHGLKVVEDAAHALPTTSAGQLVGTLASDMLVTRNADVAARAKVMRLHGINRDAFDRFSATVPSWYYEVTAPGFKYNLTDIAASLGIHQLKRLPAFQAHREQLAAQYNTALAGLPLLLPPAAPVGDVHAWHLYVVRLLPSAGVARDVFIQRLYAAGIGCSVHYIPLHLQPYWRDRYHLTPKMFEHSQQAYEAMVSLPLYTRMTAADVQRVVQAIKHALA